MPRFRVLMNRHHHIYNPGETPVLSESSARQAVASGAGEIVEELADEPIHGHPTGGAIAAAAEALGGEGVPAAELPITPGINGAPLGGDTPSTPATQADVAASLGANRAHKANERRNRPSKAAAAVPAAEVSTAEVTETVIDGEGVPVVDDAGLATPPPASETEQAGASADVDPFAGAES